MVGWSDFLASNWTAQTWHFLVGLALGLLIIVLFRMNPVWGLALLAGFIGFVLLKELYIATYIENESLNQETVSATFWFIGAGLGAGAALLPPKAGLLAAAAGIATVVGLLAIGVI
jgi:hypothetical protein